MQVRRVITAYLLTLTACLVVVAGRTVPDATSTIQEPPGYDNSSLRATPAQKTPALEVLPRPRQRPVELDVRTEDIPLTALAAYSRAAAILAEVAPRCGVSWSLLAAIGRVESNHGQAMGATLADDGTSRPGVDPAVHGVGPMRFFPSVWNVVAVDGDGDGRRSAHDLDDATLAAGIYLCSGGENLRTRPGMLAALRGYNDSERYVALVLRYERLYRNRDFLVATPSGEVTPASIVLTGPDLSATALNPDRLPRKVRARIIDDAENTLTRAARPDATKGPASPAPNPSETPSEDTAEEDTSPSSEVGESAAADAPASESTSPVGEDEVGTSAEQSDPPSDPVTPPSDPVTPPSDPTTSPSDPTTSPSDPTAQPTTCTDADPGSATEAPADPSADPSSDPAADPAADPSQSPSADASPTPTEETCTPTPAP